MTPLNWQETPQKQSSSRSGSPSSTGNPWFGVSFWLIGIIVGYLIGTF